MGSPLFRILLAGVLANVLVLAADERAVPWKVRDGTWRTDSVWYDGKAEKCVYEATRTIYGEERVYRATAYTNKQLMDPATTVKAAGSEGVEVFKHHWSERVPTENYDYDFSTAAFVRTRDLSMFKLTAATQEDCGASFKQIWRDGKSLRWMESVYFPGAGMKEGRLDADVVFEDALTLVLRDFPFDERAELPLRVVPSQKSTRSVPFEPVAMKAVCRGREPVSTPFGVVESHRVDLSLADGTARASYWFAADGGAPMLHALVRYTGPQGVSYLLAGVERTAYWERN